MRLVSFQRNGKPSYGVLTDDGIADVGGVLAGNFPDLKSALLNLDEVQGAQDQAEQLSLDDVTLEPPIPNSGRILCVGLNYRSHIAETGRDIPEYPLIFARYPDSLVGHNVPLVAPKLSKTFDFEGELAVVIGKEGRHIAPEDALDHVVGYSCFNDGSVRAFQRHSTQWLPGKSFWRSGSFGPYLLTADEVPDPGELHLQTRLNGKVMQDTGVDDLLFGVEDLIAYLSGVFPLQAGDVIATGTTGGVGAFRDPQIWMKAGDVVEVEISKLGTLSNSIVDE
ncbi:MAG: fumarylacetoacetate hydrolase family protein [Halioglobus sp.]